MMQELRQALLPAQWRVVDGAIPGLDPQQLIAVQNAAARRVHECV